MSSKTNTELIGWREEVSLSTVTEWRLRQELFVSTILLASLVRQCVAPHSRSQGTLTEAASEDEELVKVEMKVSTNCSFVFS